jgi:2-polyprenyl-3-methyl-5-hydroxy-6-metoxy-1,4-benzoquinol methylase
MITKWSEGEADVNMDEDILVELSQTIHRHPWWRARASLTIALLKRLGVNRSARVLDAGCGWGVTLGLLERCGYRADGLDISRRALDQLDRPGRLLIEADLAQPLADRFEPYDAVLALDVIEHLDDDRVPVANLGQLARPGGVVVISVPALPELFTEFDAIQGHRRRYLPESLRSAFVGSGLEVERLFWWGAWLVPLLRRQRRRTRSQPGATTSEIYSRYLHLPPWPLPWLLRIAFAVEQPPALAGALTTGTSLFAVGRKLE